MGSALALQRFDPAAHAVSAFDCGVPDLNAYLQRSLTQDQSKGFAVGYVLVQSDGDIAGYFTLSSGELLGEFNEIPITGPLKHRRSIPTTLIGRLATDLRFRGQGVGEELLMHALRLACERGRTVASAVVEVDAIDDGARAFYEKYGFVSLPDTPQHLYLSMKKVIKLFS